VTFQKGRAIVTSKVAQKRAAKALRRKRRAAMKARQAGNTASAERLRRWARGPIHACLMQAGLFERGLGMVVLARRSGTGEVAFAGFLVDVVCRGVKDVVVQRIGQHEFGHFVGTMGVAAPWEPVEPCYARKLLREAAHYAASLGFRPHRDFVAAEALFGEISADACDTVFRFGHDGKPCYIASPSESPAKIRKTLQRLRRQLGEGGFTYIVPADEIDLFDDDPWEDSLLDEMWPSEIPVPSGAALKT
jgi:hypothetical protein